MPPSPQHLTLVANTVATISFDADYSNVEVTNVDGVAAIYFRIDGTDPTVAGAGSDVVVAAVGAALQVPVGTAGNTAVKLISAGGAQGVRARCAVTRNLRARAPERVRSNQSRVDAVPQAAAAQQEQAPLPLDVPPQVQPPDVELPPPP